MIGAEPAHPIAPPDADRLQPVRESTHTAGEFCVSASRVAVDDGELIGGEPRPSFDPRADALVTHGRTSHHARSQRHSQNGGQHVAAVMTAIPVF